MQYLSTHLNVQKKNDIIELRKMQNDQKNAHIIFIRRNFRNLFVLTC